MIYVRFWQLDLIVKLENSKFPHFLLYNGLRSSISRTTVCKKASIFIHLCAKKCVNFLLIYLLWIFGHIFYKWNAQSLKKISNVNWRVLRTYMYENWRVFCTHWYEELNFRVHFMAKNGWISNFQVYQFNQGVKIYHISIFVRPLECPFKHPVAITWQLSWCNGIIFLSN